MPFLTDEDVFKNVKANIISNIYLLYGQEKYFLEKSLQQIKKKVVDKEFESFNLNIVDGDKLDLSRLEDMTDALPMMSPKRLIILNEVDFDKIKKDDLERLNSLISNISDTTVMVIYQGMLQVDMKKSSRYKKLADTISKTGTVCEFAPKDKTTLKRKMCEKARRAYMELDMYTAEYLIDVCGTSYMTLTNEMDKLISYVGSGEITKRHVDECCIKTIDSSAFDLAKSILSNNFDRAYRLLDELLYQRQEMVAVLAAAALAFADIYRAKLGVSAGKSLDEIAADFGYPKNRMFAIKNAARDIRSFSTEHIRYCTNALYEADILLKSSKLENRLILEKMLGKMLLMSINERAI